MNEDGINLLKNDLSNNDIIFVTNDINLWNNNVKYIKS